MFAGLSDPELYRFMADKPPLSIEALRQRYERLSSRQSPDGREQWLNWAIRRSLDADIAGFVQATIAEGAAEIAYVLFRSQWSQGLAHEAVLGMIEELMSNGVVSVAARSDCGNSRSRRLLERLGFVERPLPLFMQEEDPEDVWYVLERVHPRPRGPGC